MLGPFEFWGWRHVTVRPQQHDPARVWPSNLSSLVQVKEDEALKTTTLRSEQADQDVLHIGHMLPSQYGALARQK